MLARADRTGNNAPVGNLDRVVLRSSDGRITAHVDPVHGGRLARLTVDDRALLVEADHPEAHGPLAWGCYPMAPYCGRVRDSRLRFRDRVHDLPRTAAPHSIHGVTFDRPWRVTAHDTTSVEMRIDLDDRWPFNGRVTHEVRVDDGGLTMRLTLDADEDMPAMLGWHPWFVKPDRSPTELRTMLRRDAAGIATAARVERPFGVVDDCFDRPLVAPGDHVDEFLRLRVLGVDLALSSDCSHWVLFDVPAHATCVEPQSGPPNQVNDDPRVVRAGESSSRWFRIGVERP